MRDSSAQFRTKEEKQKRLLTTIIRDISTKESKADNVKERGSYCTHSNSKVLYGTRNPRLIPISGKPGLEEQTLLSSIASFTAEL